MRLFGRWSLGHTLQSKFSSFCNRKFPPISHPSGLNAKFWNFSNTVDMRKKYSRQCYQTSFWWFKSTKIFGIFVLVVLSTQLHEEMRQTHGLFLIAGNGDFRALTFVPLSRLHFWSDWMNFLGLLKHKLVSSETLSRILFFSSIPCYWNFALKPEVWETSENFRMQNNQDHNRRIITFVSLLHMKETSARGRDIIALVAKRIELALYGMS